MIKGYKAFNSDKTNRYHQKFEEHTIYSILGNPSFGNNGHGYHFCTNLADVFRYFEEDVIVAKVISLGLTQKYDDEYNGYYDMYVTNKIYIDRFLSHEEIINYFLNSSNPEEIKRFLITYSLNKEEIILFAKKFQNNYYLTTYLNYYQKKEADAFTRTLKL